MSCLNAELRELSAGLDRSTLAVEDGGIYEPEWHTGSVVGVDYGDKQGLSGRGGYVCVCDVFTATVRTAVVARTSILQLLCALLG